MSKVQIGYNLIIITENFHRDLYNNDSYYRADQSCFQRDPMLMFESFVFVSPSY